MTVFRVQPYHLQKKGENIKTVNTVFSSMEIIITKPYGCLAYKFRASLSRLLIPYEEILHNYSKLRHKNSKLSHENTKLSRKNCQTDRPDRAITSPSCTGSRGGGTRIQGGSKPFNDAEFNISTAAASLFPPPIRCGPPGTPSLSAECKFISELVKRSHCLGERGTKNSQMLRTRLIASSQLHSKFRLWTEREMICRTRGIRATRNTSR